MTANSKFVIDTFAWIEYFKGSQKGGKAGEIIKTGNCITPVIVLAELSNIYSREKNSSWEKELAFIVARTTIVDITADIAIRAGKLKTEMRKNHRSKFGLIDAVILATALNASALVLTGDRHFKGLDNVEFIGD
ncbi:MAG: type II toxin-antitoxin system VapC family toxin [Candidatus ainarchaeum sp.]|nr:type II toxin-antitoxin system VapC family toxin [Candidatus ainarchaeum sp.]